MKPIVPTSDKRRKGRSHPFLGSRELKGSSTSMFLDNSFILSTNDEADISPRSPRSSTNAFPQSETIMVSRLAFNKPASNRLDVQSLEESTHQRLKDAYNEERANKISKYERHILQIQVLDDAMKDLCGLINKNCKDQANFVWKLWSSAADVYQEVLKQLMDEIDSNKRQLVSKSLHVEELERKVSTLSKQQGIYTGSKGGGVDELSIIRQLEEELNAKDADFLRVQETLTNLSLWFPHFSKFGGSVLGRFLPPFDETDDELLGLKELKENEVQDDLKSLKDHFYLAQDYLLYDMKRLEKLGIGLEVVHTDPAKPSSQPHGHQQHHRPRREVPVSNKLSIALNQPEELQALSYGLFGGPQSSVSFSAAKENEYNLRHIENASASMISPKAGSVFANSTSSNVNTVPSTSDIEAAVSRVVAAVSQSQSQNSTHDSHPATVNHNTTTTAAAVANNSHNSHGAAKARSSPEGDFDIRLFHTLQYRRASNLSMQGYTEESPQPAIDPTRFVMREDYEMLSYTHHMAMVTVQELERQVQQEARVATDRIERLEQELRQTQLREKQLREQLKECKNEADSILISLPLNCSLPPLCAREDSGYLVKRRLQPLSLSRYTLCEVMQKTLRMFRDFAFSGRLASVTCASWNGSRRYVDNALNGHTMHWLQTEPRRLQVSDSDSVRSVALGLLAPCYGFARWRESGSLAREVEGMASSVLALIAEEVSRSYRNNHLSEHFFHSSQTPWELAPLMEKLESEVQNRQSHFDNMVTEYLIFLSRLIGFRVSVESPDQASYSANNHHLQQSSVLEVGLGESSVATAQEEASFHAQVQIQRLPPPVPYLMELPLRDQRIFFDISMHCYEAIKSCCTREGFFVPIGDIARSIRKVFHTLEVTHATATPFDVARSLLEEHGLHMTPWWRYLSPSIEQHLKEDCLRMAMEDDRNQAESGVQQGSDSDLEDEEALEEAVEPQSQWMFVKHQSLSLPQFIMNCYQATQQFERVLRRLLEEMFVFLASLVPRGPTSPLFASLLEALLQPSLLDTHASGHADEMERCWDRKVPPLPLALMEELRALDAAQNLSAMTFAEAVLRCAPSKMVDHVAPLLCMQEYWLNRSEEKKRKNQSLEDIARAGLNLSIYQQFAGGSRSGTRFGANMTSDKVDYLAEAVETLGTTGIVLLRYVEYVLFPIQQPASVPQRPSLYASINHSSSSSKPSKTKEAKDIPAVSTSVFLRSLKYRRALYGSEKVAPPTSDENGEIADEEEDEIEREKDEYGELIFSTRLLYHLRLCFDPELLAISDASLSHKWFVVCITEIILKSADVQLLHEKVIPQATSTISGTQFAQMIKPLLLISRRENLDADHKLTTMRVNSHYSKGILGSTFAAWRKYSRRHKQN